MHREEAKLKGTSNFRHPIDDPLILRMLRERGLEEVPLFSRQRRNLPAQAWRDAIERWDALSGDKDGPVNPQPQPMGDPAEVTLMIKQKARELGADDVGVAELTPIMINNNVDIPYKYVISLLVHERYSEVQGGALAIEKETIRVYVKCAEISTGLGKYIRGLGFPAMADHNGTFSLQAIPAMVACGLGEMGRHGSMIHREFGAGFRPGFVVTDLSLVPERPNLFGVQDYCMNCRLCENNCPSEAIPPSEEYVVTDGYKRWLTDIEKCYLSCRLRDEYCHICVDVCPYVHKENGDKQKIAQYKQFMGKRRQAGWRTPQWFLEDEATVL